MQVDGKENGGLCISHRHRKKWITVAQKHLLPLPASHKSHIAPQLQKVCGREGYSFQGKTMNFSAQGKATRKISWESGYSLNIAVWDSNDSHLRPMTSASELGTQRGEEGLQRRSGTRDKAGFWGAYFQCSEVTEGTQHSFSTATVLSSQGRLPGSCSWGREFASEQIQFGRILPFGLQSNTYQMYSVTLSLFCLKLQAMMGHLGFFQFLPSHLGRPGVKLGG